MAEFTIMPRAVRQTAGSLGTYSQRMSSFTQRISAVKSSISAGSSIARVKSALGTMETRAAHHARSLRSMQTVLNSCVTQYENTETRSAGKSVSVLREFIQGTLDQKAPGWKFLDSETTKDWDKKEWEGYLARYQGDGKAEEFILGLAASQGIILNGLGYKDDEAFKEIKRGEGKYGKKLYDEHWAEGKNGRKLKEPEKLKYASKKATIAEIGKEESIEAKLYGKSWGNDNANAQLTIGRAEAHSSLKAGIYGYDKDGKKVFAPAVEAAIGTSVCVANLKGEAKVGGDLLNAGADGEVSVGKASADATVKAALFGKDKNGNWNPELKASASAEAIAAEAKGSAHVTFAGVEAKVSGSVNFGIGAHADIGMVDGKIKCDIGASIGLGVSIGFEIDTKPLVNAAVSAAKALWPGNWKLW